MSQIQTGSDPLEQRLSEAFHAAELPEAPRRLRAEVESLATGARVQPSRSTGLRSVTLARLVAAVAIVALVAVSVSVLRTQPGPVHGSPTPGNLGPSQTPASSPAASSTTVPTRTLVPTPTGYPTYGYPVLPDGPGITWSTVSLAGFATQPLSVVGAAEIGGTMVVAADDISQGNAGVIRPVVLLSTDGADWQQVSTAGAEFANAQLDQLLPIPGGLLLVGESLARDPLCAGGALGCNPVSATLMWTSADGRTWKRLPAAQLAPFDRVWIVSIAAGPKGIAAFGFKLPVTGEGRNVAFHSLDGASWSSATFPDQTTGTTGVLVQSLAATSTGFVAVGSARPGGGFAWYSEDGLNWTRAVAPNGTSCGSGESAYRLIAGGGGMFAYCQGPWFSLDGRTWKVAAGSPYVDQASRIADNGSEMLVVTAGAAFWSSDGQTWHRGDSTPALPAAVGGYQTLNWILPSAIISAGPSVLYVGRVG